MDDNAAVVAILVSLLVFAVIVVTVFVLAECYRYKLNHERGRN